MATPKQHHRGTKQVAIPHGYSDGENYLAMETWQGSLFWCPAPNGEQDAIDTVAKYTIQDAYPGDNLCLLRRVTLCTREWDATGFKRWRIKDVVKTFSELAIADSEEEIDEAVEAETNNANENTTGVFAPDISYRLEGGFTEIEGQRAVYITVKGDDDEDGGGEYILPQSDEPEGVFTPRNYSLFLFPKGEPQPLEPSVVWAEPGVTLENVNAVCYRGIAIDTETSGEETGVLEIEICPPICEAFAQWSSDNPFVDPEAPVSNGVVSLSLLGDEQEETPELFTDSTGYNTWFFSQNHVPDTVYLSDLSASNFITNRGVVDGTIQGVIVSRETLDAYNEAEQNPGAFPWQVENYTLIVRSWCLWQEVGGDERYLTYFGYDPANPSTDALLTSTPDPLLNNGSQTYTRYTEGLYRVVTLEPGEESFSLQSILGWCDTNDDNPLNVFNAVEDSSSYAVGATVEVVANIVRGSIANDCFERRTTDPVIVGLLARRANQVADNTPFTQNYWEGVGVEEPDEDEEYTPNTPIINVVSAFTTYVYQYQLWYTGEAEDNKLLVQNSFKVAWQMVPNNRVDKIAYYQVQVTEEKANLLDENGVVADTTENVYVPENLEFVGFDAPVTILAEDLQPDAVSSWRDTLATGSFKKTLSDLEEVTTPLNVYSRYTVRFRAVANDGKTSAWVSSTDIAERVPTREAKIRERYTNKLQNLVYNVVTGRVSGVNTIGQKRVTKPFMKTQEKIQERTDNAVTYPDLSRYNTQGETQKVQINGRR